MKKKELSLIAPSHIVEELEKKGEYYIEREGILIRLNEQPEEEEKYKKGDRVKLALADKEGWIAGEFEIAEKTNLDWKDGDIMNTVDKEGKLHHFVLRDMMPEDTPEEWEKELRKRWYLWTYNKELDQYITCENEVIDFIQAELDRAREEGYEEGMRAVLYPKLKRDKNGTIKREGWVDTSKLKEKK